MDIFQFEQFQMIAECGTMREAAERLFLSQSTLSHNIKKLEAELGCKLFTRSSNQLRLTPYGELVLAFAKHMKSHAAGAFSGNAFIPYFLFPDDVNNLHIQG